MHAQSVEVVNSKIIIDHEKVEGNIHSESFFPFFLGHTQQWSWGLSDSGLRNHPWRCSWGFTWDARE